jgi:ribosomal protein S18 acetylase RimI-like enzyme
VQHLLVTPLAPHHAREAARLHIQGQPGTFLTSLGEEVLTVVYRALPTARGSFGFAAVPIAGSPVPRSASLAPPTPDAMPRAWDTLPPTTPLLGYISATRGIGGLFLQMATQNLPQLLPPLLHRYVQEPALALRSIQTALYPLLAHESDHEPSAELLSIMVEPAQRSHGVGALLMTAFLQECRNRALTAVTVTVDAANPRAQQFYRRHGFAAAHDISLYGRTMIVYRRSLAAAA